MYRWYLSIHLQILNSTSLSPKAGSLICYIRENAVFLSLHCLYCIHWSTTIAVWISLWSRKAVLKLPGVKRTFGLVTLFSRTSGEDWINIHTCQKDYWCFQELTATFVWKIIHILVSSKESAGHRFGNTIHLVLQMRLQIRMRLTFKSHRWLVRL